MDLHQTEGRRDHFKNLHIKQNSQSNIVWYVTQYVLCAEMDRTLCLMNQR